MDVAARRDLDDDGREGSNMTAHVLDLEELERAWNLTCTVYNDSLLEQHCSTRRDCETIEVGGTRAVVDASAGGATHVCFRGTATNHDVAMDLYYHLKPLESFASLDIDAARAAGARAHAGFATAASLVYRRVAAAAKGGPVVLSGHSLGGALALVAGLGLEMSGFFSCRVVTFGAPPAGDAKLAALCDGMLRHTRFTLRSDPIPKLGSGFLPLEHVRDFAHVFVVATRDIVAGQELLIDYKESYWKERAIMERYMGPFRAAHQPEELDRLRAALVQRRGE